MAVELDFRCSISTHRRVVLVETLKDSSQTFIVLSHRPPPNQNVIQYAEYLHNRQSRRLFCESPAGTLTVQ